MARKTQNLIVGEDGNAIKITSKDTVVTFLHELNEKLRDGRKGYDRHFNNGGPATAAYKTLPVQGKAKMIAAMMETALEVVAAGGEEAEEMSQALAAIDEYRLIAAEEIQKRKEADAFAQLSKSISPERLAAFIAQQQGNLQIPQATVTEAEAEASQTAIVPVEIPVAG